MIVELERGGKGAGCRLHLEDYAGDFVKSHFSIKKMEGDFSMDIVQLSECAVLSLSYDLKEASQLIINSEAAGLQLVFPVPDDLPSGLDSYLSNPLRIRELSVYLSTEAVKTRQQLREGNRLLILQYSHHYSAGAVKLLSSLQNGSITNAVEQPQVSLLIDGQTLTVLSQLLHRDEGQDHGLFYADSKSRELFAHLLRLAELQAKNLQLAGGRDSDKLTRVRELIDQNMETPLSIAHLARETGLGPARLRKMFKNSFGLSIHQYLLQVRMQKALELLQHSGEPIHEISILLGFKNLSNFSAAFKKYFGKPPKSFRIHS